MENFSFLELNNFLNKETQFKEPETSITKINTEKGIKQQKLRIQPNSNVARIQTEKIFSSKEPEIEKVKSDQDILKDITKHFEGEQSLMKKQEVIKTNEQLEGKVKNEEIQYKEDKMDLESNNTKEQEEEDEENEDPLKYDINTYIKKVKDKDASSYIPITLPFKDKNNNNANETINLIKDQKGAINENKMFLFQFPRQIPVNLQSQVKAKEEENVNEEPSYDANGYLISPEFKNSFKELTNNSKFGKLKIYKSGKVKMQIGDVLFDVGVGINTKFSQYCSVVTGEGSDEAILLGEPISQKLVVSPDIDSI